MLAKEMLQMEPSKKEDGGLLLASLTLAVSSVDTSSIVISVCLIDIALLFGVSIGMAGQHRTMAPSWASHRRSL